MADLSDPVDKLGVAFRELNLAQNKAQLNPPVHYQKAKENVFHQHFKQKHAIWLADFENKLHKTQARIDVIINSSGEDPDMRDQCEAAAELKELQNANHIRHLEEIIKFKDREIATLENTLTQNDNIHEIMCKDLEQSVSAIGDQFKLLMNHKDGLELKYRNLVDTYRKLSKEVGELKTQLYDGLHDVKRDQQARRNSYEAKLNANLAMPKYANKGMELADPKLIYHDNTRKRVRVPGVR